MTPSAPRAVLYRRVSTDEQKLGLAAQSEQLREEAKRRGWKTKLVTDRCSGSVPAEDRPALGPVLDAMQQGDVLIVAKLDRLSRSTLDFAKLLRRAEEGGWAIVVLDLGVDMTEPSGRLVASVLMAVAEFELEMIRTRTREGLARSSKRLGRRPGLPPIGAAARGPVSPEPGVLAALTDLREAGLSSTRIAERLNAHGHPSPRGRRWHRTSVDRLIARLDAAA